jgi:hypothetical protein
MKLDRGQFFQAAAVALIFCAEFALAMYAGAQWGWLLGLSLLVLLCLLLGKFIVGVAPGIVISELNLISLSRLQMIAWSLVIFSAYLVALVQRIVHGVPNPLDLTIDPYLWAVLGLSTISFVGTPMVLSSKKDDTPSPAAFAAASNVLNEPADQIQQNAVGKLYANTRPSDARFSDIFQGDEIGNTAYIDVSKVQMVILTVFLIGTYCVDLWAKLANPGLDFRTFTLPTFSQGQLQLLAASNAGYLTFKAINHTAGTSQ